ncbi:MAG TPA: hypothetical protein VF373_01690, partial [Prolixibacteraceae bacterium]
MKRITLLAFTTLLALITFSQSTPLSFLNYAPDPPQNVCEMKGDEEGDLQTKISELTDSLVAIIDRQNAITDEFIEKNGDEMNAGAFQNVGFAGATAKKVKNAENMSDAEVEAMATQMMQQKLNLSMSDLKDLDKLDSTGQKAWAEGVATEQMANAQTNPKQAHADQLRFKSQYKMASQQKLMLDKQIGGESKYSQQLDSLDHDAARAKIKLEIRLKPLYKQLETASDDQAVGIYRQIHELQDQYCQQFTPRYLQILADYKVYVRKLLPEISKMEANQNKLTKSQTGIAKNIVQPNQIGFEEVK